MNSNTLQVYERALADAPSGIFDFVQSLRLFSSPPSESPIYLVRTKNGLSLTLGSLLDRIVDRQIPYRALGETLTTPVLQSWYLHTASQTTLCTLHENRQYGVVAIQRKWVNVPPPADLEMGAALSACEWFLDHAKDKAITGVVENGVFSWSRVYAYPESGRRSLFSLDLWDVRGRTHRAMEIDQGLWVSGALVVTPTQVKGALPWTFSRRFRSRQMTGVESLVIGASLQNEPRAWRRVLSGAYWTKVSPPAL